MKLFVFLLLLPISLLAIEREVVILTSIESPESRPFWYSKSYDVEKSIEKKFRKHFDESGYHLIFKHKAEAKTLESYLQSPKTLALFWVSHAKNSRGMFSDIIMDINLNNVKDVFKKVHPNLRYLGLIGCKTGPILTKFTKQGYYKNNPDLVTHSFNKKVGLSKGIKESIKASSVVLDIDPASFSKPKVSRKNKRIHHHRLRNKIIGNSELMTLNHNEEENIFEKEGFRVTITNSEPDFSAILTVRDHFIGILDHTTHPQSFIIPFSSVLNGRYKLKVNYERDVLGLERPLQKISILSSMGSHTVTPLLNLSGDIYGKKENYYYIDSH